MRDCTIFTVCRCVYRQYVFGHEYGGAKVETDAAPREKEEPGGGHCGSRMLCAGSRGSVGKGSRHRYSDRKQLQEGCCPYLK